MSFFEVDQEKCKQDGICAQVCPFELIDFKKGEYPSPAENAEDMCLLCGHCVAVCPTGSFSHINMPTDKCPQVKKKLKLSVEECEHFLRSRRSIRVYKDKPVAREDISRLVHIARYAPSGHNSQGAKWLVLDNKDELHELAGLVIEWMHGLIKKMPDFALAMHMDKAVERWDKGNDVILRNAPAVIVAYAEKKAAVSASTCTLALSYLELASISMGLGCCWAGYFNAAASMYRPMIKKLAVGEDYQCFGSMMIGRPKFRYHRLPLRNAPHITWR